MADITQYDIKVAALTAVATFVLALLVRKAAPTPIITRPIRPEVRLK